MSQVSHKILQIACKKTYSQYTKALSSCETTQLHLLEKLLKQYQGIEALQKLSYKTDYATFSSVLPETDYDFWRQNIERQRETSKELVGKRVFRFEPTSGSTHNIKWIPYTKAFRAELDSASSPWLYDLYKRYPEIAKGKHYWSLSWLPDDLRKARDNDDAELFPWYKKALLKSVMLMDKKDLLYPTAYEAQKATALKLLLEPISLISVWSPTFLLSLLDLIRKERDFFSEQLRDARLYEKSEALKQVCDFTPELARVLWPDLKLISAWDSSTSAHWAEKVQKLFTHVPFQGKGLWATEGVLSIPFQEKYPLAVQSHFYEFKCLQTGKVLPSWKLDKGQIVKPLLTTGSGLFRYKLEDEVEVEDFLGDTPCFRFLRRACGVDMVGEKTSPSQVADLFSYIEQEFSLRPLSLVAHKDKTKSRYELIAEGSTEQGDAEARAEDFLKGFFHYKLARDLGQLEPLRLTVCEDALAYYKQICSGKISIEGNEKIESLIEL